MADDTVLRVNEIFYSIQGESLWVGKPTLFIRLSGCNLRCVWCDTKYAFWEGSYQPLEVIQTAIQNHSCSYVCLTGGEPLGQKGIYPLMDWLCEQGYQTSLETGGGFSIEKVPDKIVKILDIKCPDSGETKSMVWENINYMTSKDQYKFVISSLDDFKWSLETVKSRALHQQCTVLFSPVFGKLALEKLASWILENKAPVTMQAQLHKFIWEPSRRGV